MSQGRNGGRRVEIVTQPTIQRQLTVSPMQHIGRTDLCEKSSYSVGTSGSHSSTSVSQVLLPEGSVSVEPPAQNVSLLFIDLFLSNLLSFFSIKVSNGQSSRNTSSSSSSSSSSSCSCSCV